MEVYITLWRIALELDSELEVLLAFGIYLNINLVIFNKIDANFAQIGNFFKIIFAQIYIFCSDSKFV
jgi:hypothetical protein